MERSKLEELHYITHVDNVGSICDLGVLSHRRASKVAHIDVSLAEVQDRRKGKRVPGGLLLHDYANTYVTARNPMLFKRVREGMLDELCVIRVSPAILDLDGVVMTDKNAAASYCRFRSPNEALPDVDHTLVTRTYWTDGNALEQERCWNAKFTEVLVPQSIDLIHLTGIYVGSSSAESHLVSDHHPLVVTSNPHLFFQ